MSYSRHGDDCGRARWINAAAVVLSGCLLANIPAQAAGGHWTMTAVDGVAMVVVSGDEGYVAKKGHPVTVGTTLVTGADSTVTLMRRGDSITVYPNSEVTVPDTSNSAHLGVVQSLGRLLYRMETRESWNFEVQTPHLAATVKGTVFTVEVTNYGATVLVTEGMVKVEPAGGGESNMVRAGNRASVNVANADQLTVENVAPERNSSWRAGRMRGKPAHAAGDNGTSTGRGSHGRGDGRNGNGGDGNSSGGKGHGRQP